MKNFFLRNSVFWRGMTALLALILALFSFGTACALNYEGTVNSFLNIETTQIDNSAVDPNEDLIYYKSEFGDYTEANLRTMQEAVYAHIAEEAREGSTLMSNNGVLPLDVGSQSNISLFGFAAYDPLYHTSGAGSRTYLDPELTVSFKEALEEEGFRINETLFNAYGSMDPRTTIGAGGPPGFGATTNNNPDLIKSDGNKNYRATGNCEAPASIYTDEVRATFADYNDAAIVVLAREGGEGSDMAVSEDDTGTPDVVETMSSLALHQNEKDMLEIVAENFDNIIVIVNTTYFLELDWLDDYGVDACLWIGSPGTTGFRAVADILSGESNPSGRLSDTWAADSLSSPAIVNEAGNTPTWSNVNDFAADGIITDKKNTHVAVEQENIYVGYKYYETRYADGIMNNSGNALSSVGAFRSQGNTWNYADEMCFTFGWGLSYTTFAQTIERVTYDADTDMYTVGVRVENTGDTAGKCAVLVYAQTPYGDYEREYEVEKSAIQFVGYDKTDILAPGESVTVEVPVERYMLASYDQEGAKGYILSGGDYYFAVGDSAHDALNNILAVQGYTGMFDQDGTADDTLEADSVYKLTQGVPSDNGDPDTESYCYSVVTGNRVTNAFAEQDINYWSDDTGVTVKYLTRSDWAGTFPTKAVSVPCEGEEMQKRLQGETYEMPADAQEKYAEINQGSASEEAEILFVEMRGEAYDSPKWETFLDQLTIEEMATLLANMHGSQAIARVGLPQIIGGDGCNGTDIPFGDTIGYGDKAENYYVHFGGNFTSVLAATWNKELQERRGELMAEEMLFMGINETWSGGGDLRRTPFSGRNYEYYSEDANVSYLVGMTEMSAMQAKGINAGIKHFAGNDWETQRNGVAIFYREQAFREGSLRGFEGAMRDDKGGALAAMGIYGRQGLTYSPACYSLNKTVLRDEWGFRGHIITDAAVDDYASHFVEQLMGYNDSFCFDMGGASTAGIIEHITTYQDGYVLERLRDATRNTLYSYTLTSAVNGLSPDTRIIYMEPWWIGALNTAITVSAILTADCAAMLVLSTFVFGKKKEENR